MHGSSNEAPRTILITGAAGNLGSRLARHLVRGPYLLRLMEHRTPLPDDLRSMAHVQAVRADLRDLSTLVPALQGADVVAISRASCSRRDPSASCRKPTRSGSRTS